MHKAQEGTKCPYFYIQFRYELDPEASQVIQSVFEVFGGGPRRSLVVTDMVHQELLGIQQSALACQSAPVGDTRIVLVQQVQEGVNSFRFLQFLGPFWMSSLPRQLQSSWLSPCLSILLKKLNRWHHRHFLASIMIKTYRSSHRRHLTLKLNTSSSVGVSASAILCSCRQRINFW